MGKWSIIDVWQGPNYAYMTYHSFMWLALEPTSVNQGGYQSNRCLITKVLIRLVGYLRL